MRTLAIGDIHGCLTAFDTLLEMVALAPGDRLITLGDYVDRGPHSKTVLDRLIALWDQGLLVPLRGNHDEMMVDGMREGQSRRLWLRFGGVQTLQSYGHVPSDDLYPRIPRRHLEFLDQDCSDWYETQTHLYVHATMDPDLPPEEQSVDSLRWDRLGWPIAHCSGKVLICGHTRQESGLPLNLQTTICIDTGAYALGGWLTCLHVETGHYWQANEASERREGDLEMEA